MLFVNLIPSRQVFEPFDKQQHPRDNRDDVNNPPKSFTPGHYSIFRLKGFKSVMLLDADALFHVPVRPRAFEIVVLIENVDPGDATVV